MPYHLSERDLDLIQLEEFHAPSGYAEWFAVLHRLGDWRFGLLHIVYPDSNPPGRALLGD